MRSSDPRWLVPPPGLIVEKATSTKTVIVRRPNELPHINKPQGANRWCSAIESWLQISRNFEHQAPLRQSETWNPTCISSCRNLKRRAFGQAGTHPLLFLWNWHHAQRMRSSDSRGGGVDRQRDTAKLEGPAQCRRINTSSARPTWSRR